MGELSASELQQEFERIFAAWVQDLDLTVAKASRESVTIVMRPGKRLVREGGIVSGQALMAAADTAMVLAIYAACGESLLCATVDMSTSFLKPATSADLTIYAEITRLGRQMAFARAEIRSGADDKLVVTASGTYAMPPR